MLAVPVGEVKNRLSFFLHLIESQGQTIQITRHGKPIAFINNTATQEKISRQNSFESALAEWREKNANLFSNEEIDQIFERDRTIEDDVRHREDFDI